MHRLSIAILLLTATILSIFSAQSASAKEFRPQKSLNLADSDKSKKTTDLLHGKWKISYKPVNADGKPCPYLPDTIEFFTDKTLMMSNIADIHMDYKTDLTDVELQAFDKRPGFKVKQLVLVRPTPEIAWKATPMVYNYEVTKDVLTLAIEGWEQAVYTRVK
jgi:hypothetical protein